MHFVLAPGVRIADRYELNQLIGEGGMGSVWNARHLALDAPVAIKFVRMQSGEPERFSARFQREAKLAASVRHRNVVSMTDYGTLPDGSAFMVMDYLVGEPLSHYLHVRRSAAEMVYLMELTTRGLVAVHDAGIVHRDLKPENIFLVREATGVYPKLIDFGISKQLRPDDERRSAVTTSAGAIVGTPAYMSPEQARGLLDIDQRTDIYSMGVILYEALSGRLPYDSPYVGDLIVAIVRGGAPHLHELRPDLDRRLCDVVMRAMASAATARFQTVRELLAALSSVAPLGDNMLRSDRPPSQVDMRLLDVDRLPTVKLESSDGRDAVAESSDSESEPLPRMPPGRIVGRSAIVAGVIALVLLGVWIGMRRASESSIPIATPLKTPPPSAAAEATTHGSFEPAPPVAGSVLAAPTQPIEPAVPPEPAAQAEPAAQFKPTAKPGAVTRRADPKSRVNRPDRERRKRVITELDY